MLHSTFSEIDEMVRFFCEFLVINRRWIKLNYHVRLIGFRTANKSDKLFFCKLSTEIVL